MPVDEARFVEAIFDPDAERLADFRLDAESAVGLSDVENGSGLAIYFNAAAL